MQVMIADDHPLYLDAVKSLLIRAFCGADCHFFSVFPDALAYLKSNPVDLAMLDYSMPGMKGADGVRAAVAAAGNAPVLVMSGIADSAEVGRCIAAGAKGFLPKTLDGRVFAAAVALVLRGGTYVPAELLRTAEAEPCSESDFSGRDAEFLRLIAIGVSNKEIARRVGLQEVTVKFHLSRLFRRLGVKNRAQAAVAAVRMGFAPAQ